MGRKTTKSTYEYSNYGHYSLLETLGYISVVESLGISSTTFTQCAPKATGSR